MLRGSIVFMSRRLRGQWTTVVLVFVLKLNIASTTQIQHDNVMRFSGDFEGFLKDLGSLVYKKKGVSVNDVHSNNDRYTTPSHKHFRRSQNNYNTQKAALGDVLMMKLVSYYEDKYKLTHAEATPTESITFMPDLATYIPKYNVDMIDHRPLHLPHENNYLTDQSRQAPSRLDRNRRMERNNARNYEEPIPEVVIL
ncbi:unnamed protein product [Chrysodeixis includens]|uniref:Uncharacterized protein n=1 Tax=Chrysodeixis includens TaxID=689277 RepID=A0A9P0FY72_CHRIL|nr:unnamed protein product [Chrysodeixis includens]